MIDSIQFRCRNGELVSILPDEDDYRLRVKTQNNEDVGELEFKYIEGDHGMDVLKLVWAYLDKLGPNYLRQGIGTKCIKVAIDFWSLPVISEGHTGMTNDEGSHLTGDAPAFISSLRSKDLIG